MHGNRFAAAHRVDTFVRLSFDADLLHIDPEGARQAAAHRLDVRQQLRAVAR